MVLKKHYLGHSAGDEVRWLKDGKLSNLTGILKGFDESTLKWVVKTKDGMIRTDLISDEKERVAYWKGFDDAYKKGFYAGMKYAKENKT